MKPAIPPEKTHRFLRAAAAGIADNGLTWDEAREEFMTLLCRATIRRQGSYKKAAATLNVSVKYLYKRVPFNLQAKPEDIPRKPEEPQS